MPGFWLHGAVILKLSNFCSSMRTAIHEYLRWERIDHLRRERN